MITRLSSKREVPESSPNVGKIFFSFCNPRLFSRTTQLDYVDSNEINCDIHFINILFEPRESYVFVCSL